MAMFEYTRQSWMFDTHHGKGGRHGHLRDNDMHLACPSDFRRLRNLYVELGVRPYFKCKIAFCLSSCCTSRTT
jgi:hypothetical protein